MRIQGARVRRPLPREARRRGALAVPPAALPGAEVRAVPRQRPVAVPAPARAAQQDARGAHVLLVPAGRDAHRGRAAALRVHARALFAQLRRAPRRARAPDVRHGAPARGRARGAEHAVEAVHGRRAQAARGDHVPGALPAAARPADAGVRPVEILARTLFVQIERRLHWHTATAPDPHSRCWVLRGFLF